MHQAPCTMHHAPCMVQGDACTDIGIKILFYSVISSRPRAALVCSKEIDQYFTPLLEFTDRDLGTVLYSPPSGRATILASVYWDDSLSSLPQMLLDLCSYAKSSGHHIILAGDFNAHHPIWGSTNTNRRGSLLLDLIDEQGLEVHNNGSHTFHNSTRSEALDLTLSSPHIDVYLHRPFPVRSLYDRVRYLLHIPSPSQPRTRRFHRITSETEWTKFVDNVEDLAHAHKRILDSPAQSYAELDNKVAILDKILERAYNSTGSTSFISQRALDKKKPYWNKLLKEPLVPFNTLLTYLVTDYIIRCLQRYAPQSG